jgi:hypothetical protein
MKKNCLHCGKEFETIPARVKVGKGKYCSQHCYFVAKGKGKDKRKRFCKGCGKEFFPLQSQIDRGVGIFCSQQCHGLSRVGIVKPISERKLIEKTCEICGVKFYTPNSDNKRGYGRFCSISCRSVWQSEFQKGKTFSKDTLLKMSNSHKGKLPWNVGVSPSEETKQKNRLAHIGMMVGEKHPQWKGGISFEPYCPKFNKEFKERVRAFFGYKCAECGAPQNGGKLPVHHVNFNKDTCCDESIPLFVALCPSCHSKTNHNRPYWQQHFNEIINKDYGGKCYLPKPVSGVLAQRRAMGET